MTRDQASRAPSWALLKNLAQNDSDASARALAALGRRHAHAAGQLATLNDYRADYRARLDGAARNGIGCDGLRNYRAFLGNLEAAILQQANVLASLEHELRAARAAWQKHERRVGSYQVLDDRVITAVEQDKQRREQGEQDEMAARAYLKRVMAGD